MAKNKKAVSANDRLYKNPVSVNDHWQMDVGASVFPKYHDNPKDAFLAGNGSKRPQPHVMVNECDH